MRKDKQSQEHIAAEERPGISEIASHYLDSVGGSLKNFYEFAQFTQSAGEAGGPATDGGAFWMQVIKTYPQD